MTKSKKKFKKVLIVVIILVAAAAAVFCSLLFSNSSYSLKQYKSFGELFDKIVEAQKGTGTVELNENELNGILSPFLQKSRNFKGITVKGENIKIGQKSLDFYVPISFKGIDMLASTSGRVYLDGSNIVYSPEYFKVGKINLPKSYVIEKLSGKLGNNVKVEDEKFVISKSILPVDIDNIEVSQGKLVLKINKAGFEKIQKYINGSISGGESENTGVDAASQESTGESAKDNGSAGSQDSSSQSEQTIASEIVSAVNSKDKSRLEALQPEYNKLSEAGKARVKAAVVSGIGPEKLKQIQEKYGN